MNVPDGHTDAPTPAPVVLPYATPQPPSKPKIALDVTLLTFFWLTTAAVNVVILAELGPRTFIKGHHVLVGVSNDTSWALVSLGLVCLEVLLSLIWSCVLPLAMAFMIVRNPSAGTWIHRYCNGKFWLAAAAAVIGILYGVVHRSPEFAGGWTVLAFAGASCSQLIRRIDDSPVE